MTRGAPPHPGIDPLEWASLLATRSPEGTVDADDVAHVLRNVELNEDLIRHIESVLRELNIEQVAHEPILAPTKAAPAKRGEAKARPPRKGLAHTPVGDGADAVRLYLHEIGQIELLSAEEERVLA